MPFAVVGLRLRALLSALALIVLVLLVQPAGAVSPNLVVSQVYGGGGNSGATFTHDFIEIFNRGTTSVSTSGWSVQYTSASGTGNFGSATNLITELPAIDVAPSQYVLVQEASNAAVGLPLPTPDVTRFHSHQHVWSGRKGRAGQRSDGSRLQRRLDAVRRVAAGAHRRSCRVRHGELLRGLRPNGWDLQYNRGSTKWGRLRRQR